MIIRLILAIASLQVMACSDEQRFAADEGSEDDSDGVELADEPVMIGGAYLTCGYKEQEQKRYKDGLYHVGCRIARRSDRKTISLHDYTTRWLLVDADLNDFETQVVQDNTSAAVLPSEDAWHRVYGFKDLSFKTARLDVLVAKGDAEVGFDTTLNFFDESNDREQPVRLTRFFSISEVDFIPAVSAPTATVRSSQIDLGSLINQAFAGMNEQFKSFDWGRHRNSCYQRKKRKPPAASNSGRSSDSGPVTQNSSGSASAPNVASAESGKAPTGSELQKYGLVNPTRDTSQWSVSGASTKNQAFVDMVTRLVGPSDCMPADYEIQRASGHSVAHQARTVGGVVDFRKPGTCLLDYYISSKHCAGVFVIEQDPTSPLGYRTKTKVVDISEDPIGLMKMLRKTIEFHGCRI